ncbi:MAG: Asp-tRNA(Asn)/Glu-tRNA(Gln) amidotransferase subunit GatB [Pseudomonadota bacterium]
MSINDFEAVIGLEIHVQLNTRTKIFSAASTTFGAGPNTQASLVDLGFPGVLPVVNEAVFRKAVAFGLGIGATINRRSSFDRKNYFYPDLPKGYQITQLAAPIVVGGKVVVTTPEGESLEVRVTRAHLEEDAGKSVHEDFHGQSGIDLNRAGTPLLEIVSEPDMHSASEAVAYARQIHQLVTYLDVSDGDMSQGSFRCDANVSVRRHGDTTLGTRTETKNVNSFRFLERAINYEIDRQVALLESGGRVIQETRLFDPDRDETRSMRSKETAMDYRYFPDPDLLPVELTESFVESIRQSMPELPGAKIHRFINDYDLPPEDARVLASSRALADYFETVASVGGDAKLASNWVRVELLGRLNRDDQMISASRVTPEDLGRIISRIKDGTISGKIAKTVFDALWNDEAASPDDYINQQGLTQVSDSSELAPIIDRIIAANPAQAEQFRAGKTKLLGFFVGQVMKETGGKANPQQVNELVSARLLE